MFQKVAVLLYIYMYRVRMRISFNLEQYVIIFLYYFGRYKFYLAVNGHLQIVTVGIGTGQAVRTLSYKSSPSALALPTLLTSAVGTPATASISDRVDKAGTYTQFYQ